MPELDASAGLQVTPISARPGDPWSPCGAHSLAIPSGNVRYSGNRLGSVTRGGPIVPRCQGSGSGTARSR